MNEAEPENRLSEYELQRLERIRKNEAYLESLGLLNHKAKMMRQTTRKTKRSQRRAAARVEAGEERRSHRLKTAATQDADTPKLMMLSYANADDRVETPVGQGGYYDGMSDESSSPTSFAAKMKRESGPDAGRPSTSFRTTRRIVLGNHEDFVLTEAEKQTLATMDSNYLEKFQEFLVYHNKISEQNVRNVMRQVTKLASGQGVRYDSRSYGWKSHQIFQKGVKVTPLSDFVELMELAQQAEDEWGRDHGNGWLLRHPLKKMLLFQQFCLQNPDFLTSKCRLKEYYAMDDDEEDDVEDFGTEVEDKSPSPGDSDKVNPVSPERSESNDKRSGSSKQGKEPPNKKSRASKEQLELHLGSRVAKEFDDGGVYFGTVSQYDPKSKWWWIVYDDGDQEDMNAEELDAALELYSEHQQQQ